MFLTNVFYLCICNAALASKHHLTDQLNVITNDAFDMIDDYFPSVEENKKIQWKLFFKRKRNQFMHALNAPNCFNQSAIVEDFQLVPRPLCNGIEALNHIEETYRTWTEKFITDTCRKNFAPRMIARVMSFVSQRFAKVEVLSKCNPRIQMRTINPIANVTHGVKTDRCPNLKFESVSAMMIKSSAPKLQIVDEKPWLQL